MILIILRYRENDFVGLPQLFHIGKTNKKKKEDISEILLFQKEKNCFLLHNLEDLNKKLQHGLTLWLITWNKQLSMHFSDLEDR